MLTEEERADLSEFVREYHEDDHVIGDIPFPTPAAVRAMEKLLGESGHIKDWLIEPLLELERTAYKLTSIRPRITVSMHSAVVIDAAIALGGKYDDTAPPLRFGHDIAIKAWPQTPPPRWTDGRYDLHHDTPEMAARVLLNGMMGPQARFLGDVREVASLIAENRRMKRRLAQLELSKDQLDALRHFRDDNASMRESAAAWQAIDGLIGDE